MAFIVIDNFDSYSDGNLNGQGGWSGSTTYQVQSSVVWQGTKAVGNTSGTNDVEIVKSITPRTKGIFSIYLRREWTSQYNIAIALRNSGTRIGTLVYRTNGSETPILYKGDFSSSAAFGTVPTISTWVKFDIEIDQANSQLRARMNDGTWSSWVSQSFAQVNEILLGKASNGSTANAYYDYITFDDLIPGGGG